MRGGDRIGSVPPGSRQHGRVAEQNAAGHRLQHGGMCRVGDWWGVCESQSISFEVCWVADHVVANLRRHSTITTLSCCERNDNKVIY